MVSESAALKSIRDNLKPGPGETVPLSRALGRAPTTDIRAPDDFPPFACSFFDGYAVRAVDVRGAAGADKVELRVVGTAVAGETPRVSLKKEQALRIMTGAPLPSGADAVVKQEDVEAKGERLLVKHPVKRGEGVRVKGEEAKKGEKVLNRGVVIGPEEMGFLASLGVGKVEVYARPRVALIMIGDELVAPGRKPPPGKIRAGNALMLRSLVLKYGGMPWDMGIVPDSEERIARAMRRASEADMAITAGGSGGGIHDLTAEAFTSVNGRSIFQEVSIWPGGTLSFGLLKGTPFFMLPGGPRTGSICFHIFVREALGVMCPSERSFSLRVKATMLNTLRGRAGVTNYLQVNVRKGKKGYYATRSRALPPPDERCALAVLPPGKDRVRRGDEVEIVLA